MVFSTKLWDICEARKVRLLLRERVISRAVEICSCCVGVAS